MDGHIRSRITSFPNVELQNCMKTIIYVKKSYIKQNNEKIIKISSLHNQNIPEIIIPDNVFHPMGFWLFNIKIIYQKRFIDFLLKDIKVKLLSKFNLNLMGQFYKIYKIEKKKQKG